MIKIELTDTILELHKAYFNKYVKPNFNKKICINKNEVSRIRVKFPMYNRKFILQQHKEFMNYCINRSEDISIGNPTKLKGIVEYVNQNISCIENLIKYDVKFSYNTTKPTKDCISYKDVLLKAFRYESKFAKQDTEIIGTANSIMSQSQKNQIIKKIMTYNYGIKQKNIEELLNLLHDEWKVSEKKITDKKEHFIGFWGAYAFTYLTRLKACPYCNRQYISPILTNSGMMRGDLDHFFPKDKFPYLSLSIYNLIPVCKFCNSSFKGNKEFGFNDIHPYEESIDDYAKFKINISQNGQININLEEMNNSSGKVKNFINMFKLDHQYSFHTDQAQELIQKRIMYPRDYIEQLRKYLSINGISDERLSEIIIGYTIDKEKTNEEVLSKYKRDLVEQLGLDMRQNSIDTSLIDELERRYNKR